MINNLIQNSSSPMPARSLRQRRAESEKIAALSVKPNVEERALTNLLLSGFNENSFENLLPHLETVALKTGEELNRSGEPDGFLYFPNDAVISQLHVLRNGGTAEIALIGHEGVVGLSGVLGDNSPRLWTCVTLSGSAVRIRTELLQREFQENSVLRDNLLAYAGAYFNQISQRAICNLYHQAEARFCYWLTMLAERSQQRNFALTHDQIARHLGVHRPVITQIAINLRDCGVVNYRRGMLRLTDVKKLEKMACECVPLTVSKPLPQLAARSQRILL